MEQQLPQLSPQQSHLLIVMSQTTGRTAQQLLDDALETIRHKQTDSVTDAKVLSLRDRLEQHGTLGSLCGPADLNTNPNHMDGFGL